MQQKKIRFYTYLVISMFLWGSSFVLTKHLLNNFNPITLTFIRCAIASLVFALICYLFYNREFRIAKKDLKYFVGMAFFEPFIYFIFETYSLKFCDASIVSVIIATIPLFVALMAVTIFREKLSALNFVGIILSILGIIIMLWHSVNDAGFSFFGALLAFGAVFSTIGYNYFLKKLPASYPPIVVITWQNILGLVAFSPLVFLVNDSESTMAQFYALGNITNLSFILILAIFCSTVAFILYIDAMRTLGVARTNIFVNLIPVMTAIFAYFVLKEEITITKVLGIVVVIMGIFMVQQKRKRG